VEAEKAEVAMVAACRVEADGGEALVAVAKVAAGTAAVATVAAGPAAVGMAAEGLAAAMRAGG
jgi:hypothetical protein